MTTKPANTRAIPAIVASHLALLFAIVFTLAACAKPTPPPPAEESAAVVTEEGVPGGIFVNTLEVSAKVTGIDTVDRELTLLKPNGEEITVSVGPEAVNFNQIQKGDLVKAVVTEELVIYLDEEGASTQDEAAMVVARAPEGGQPGALAVETVQFTATVMAIDMANHTATLQFEDGQTKTIPVRDDVDLSKRKVGEKVVFSLTEMVAISVEKP